MAGPFTFPSPWSAGAGGGRVIFRTPVAGVASAAGGGLEVVVELGVASTQGQTTTFCPL